MQVEVTKPLEIGKMPEVRVNLQKTTAHSSARPLWAAIKERTEAISFQKYRDFVDDIFGKDQNTAEREPACGGMRKCRIYRDHFDDHRRFTQHLPHGVDGYNLLKTATQIFLLLECGIVIRGPRDESGVHDDEEAMGEGLWRCADRPKTFAEAQERLRSYLTDVPGGWLERIKERLDSQPDGWLRVDLRSSCPCLQELIWNYWMEEAGVVQALNAIGLRFQNRRHPGKPRDPLIEMEITPLRRINNLLWGHLQDEQHRLSVRRRAYEYDHHYGITLLGPAVPNLQPVDSRSKFIEAFHYLLNHAYKFLQDQADKTVEPDPFPIVSDLREVHLLLTEGAHNQYGDLPWQSRVEFLLMQYLLHLPDMREFLRSRAMVNYPEEWMGPLDAMNRLQRWTDVSSVQYYYLATYGEQLLLSIRHNNWMHADVDPEDARDWVQYWSREIQGYIHAYRAVAGADLTHPNRIDTTMPAVLLRERRREPQRRLASLPRPQVAR